METLSETILDTMLLIKAQRGKLIFEQEYKGFEKKRMRRTLQNKRVWTKIIKAFELIHFLLF